MSQSASLSLALAIAQSTNGDINSAVNNITLDHAHLLSDGTGADQATQAFSDERTLSASSNEDLDLAGVLTDVFGASITFTAIKAILLVADAGNGDNIELGGAATNALVNWVGDASDKVVIPPGGMFLITAPDATGFPVTAGTADLLRVANADGAASGTYKIVIIGIE